MNEIKEIVNNIKENKEQLSKKSLWELQREKLALKWLIGQGFIGGAKQVPEHIQYTFIRYCVDCDLNPTLKEVYLIQMGKDYAPFTSADVYYRRAMDSKQLEGFKFTLIDKDENGVKLEQKDWEGIFSIKKFGSDYKWEFRTFFREYTKGQASWKSMPYLMFEKCSMVNGLRKAFPDIVRGLPYAIEEQWSKQEPKELEIIINKELGEENVIE